MTGGLRVFDAEAVRAGLSVQACIPVVRDAMIALSSGRVRQNLRSFIALSEGRTFAMMPASLGEDAVFGAKLVSVFESAEAPGRKRHRGLVILFDGRDGVPICVADAEEITRIRTAAASAAATEALARPEADTLAVLGLGVQAAAHIEAIAAVRDLREVRVWGRDLEKARAFAKAVAEQGGPRCVTFQSAADAVAASDIVCTVTGASDPVLKGAWVKPGAHVNLVGSSGPARAEADAQLVAESRFIADHEEHVRAHGGEFLRALEAGVIPVDHVAAEIGAVYAGAVPGRTSAEQVTVYKSLGHAVQDLAAAAWLYKHEGGRL